MNIILRIAAMNALLEYAPKFEAEKELTVEDQPMFERAMNPAVNRILNKGSKDCPDCSRPISANKLRCWDCAVKAATPKEAA